MDDPSLISSIRFLPAVSLTDVRTHRNELDHPGIYLIVEGGLDGKPDGLPPNVVYIGKGDGEGIWKRGCKHLQTIVDGRTAKGKPTTANSEAFRRYRESIGKDAGRLSFIAGLMNGAFPSSIAFAEARLLELFHDRHGRLPVCNTAGGPRRAKALKASVSTPGSPPARAKGDRDVRSLDEDRILVAFCEAFAASHALAFKVVPMGRTPEARIGLRFDPSGDLGDVVVRLAYRPLHKTVVVTSRLSVATASKWGTSRERFLYRMRSETRVNWPFDPAALQAMLDAALAEARVG